MEQRGPKLDSAVQSYYDLQPEEDRLSRGPSRLEAERTRALIERFAPPPPAVVLDVGGAAGAYAFWLASLGHDVHLLDPVERLVDLARERSGSSSAPLASARVGDARDLPFAEASADLVLLLGPLYHLTVSEDRARALQEAARVLRSGGILFAVCITRWASLLDGLTHDYLADPRFAAIVEQDLRTGQHRNDEGHPGYFTTAYFHRPEEFEEELLESGLEVEGLFGLEGPGFLLSDFDERWGHDRTRADLLRAAAAVEAEPSLRGLSPHLLGVCRKGRGP
jgi:ubiquinone/menaquinone biosynthesis C-methylase UbiE